jgi:hypothetical protein
MVRDAERLQCGVATAEGDRGNKRQGRQGLIHGEGYLGLILISGWCAT